MQSIRLVIKIARFYSSELFTYPFETLAQLTRRILTVGMLLLFWSLVAKDNDVAIVQIVPYIFIASGVLFLTVGQNFPQASRISEDIKSGALNNILLKPVSELDYQLGAYFGRSILEFIFSLINTALGLLLLDGLTASKAVLFVISLVPAFFIGYALNIMIAASAFWIIEISKFRMLSYFILRIISGLFMPLTFFGSFWSEFLQHLPFAQLAFVPSFILTSDDPQKALTLMLVGAVEAILMMVLAKLIWRQGLKRYGAVGV